MGAIDLCGSGNESGEANEKMAYVQELVERALNRSFGETGAAEIVTNVDTGEDERNEKPAAAIKRVNMITEYPDKVHRLTEMFVEKSNGIVDSPAVNKMLDMFA